MATVQSERSATKNFSHTVRGDGPAQGMHFSGLQRIPGDAPAEPDVPLVIAVHGGTYTSSYFDVPGYSLLDRAEALGIPLMAIDRPGYRDSSPVAPGDSIILKNAEVLDHLIAELWEQTGVGRPGVVLIGHSIGSATVTALAARQPEWPLLGIAISGSMLQVPPESGEAWVALPDQPVVELPHDVKNAVMFGPDWTHTPDMPEASNVAAFTVPKAELIDITSTWTDWVREVAARVTVPVYARQAEFDHLCITDAEQVELFGKAFVASPRVDARLFLSAGHCIDFHRLGGAFQLGQLAFALECGLVRL